MKFPGSPARAVIACGSSSDGPKVISFFDVNHGSQQINTGPLNLNNNWRLIQAKESSQDGVRRCGWYRGRQKVNMDANSRLFRQYVCLFVDFLIGCV